MKSAVKRGFRFALVQISIVGIAVTTSSGAMTTQAFGSGWSLNSSLSERVEFNDNIDMTSTGAKSAYGSTTSLNTSLGWQGFRRNIKLNSNFDIRRFYGPGARPELDTFNHSHTINFSLKRKTTTYSYSASYRVQDATSVEDENTGIFTRIDNNQISTSLNANVHHQVNSRLSASLSASANFIDFEKNTASVSPYRNFSLNGSLTQMLSKRVTGTLSMGASFYNSDDIFNSESITYRFSGRLATKFTARHSAHIQVGAVYTENDNGATLTSLASSNESLTSSFDVGMNYKLKNTNFSLSASSSVSPTSFGRLQSNTRFGFNVSHQINHRSSVGIGISSNQGDTGNSLSIAPNYSYKFAKYWNANLGYSYRTQESGGKSATSNSVFFSISRAFTHLP